MQRNIDILIGPWLGQLCCEKATLIVHRGQLSQDISAPLNKQPRQCRYTKCALMTELKESKQSLPITGLVKLSLLTT